MCEYYNIVPWYDSNEWHRAHDAIYSENSRLQDALNLLLLWKARSPSLPSGIESTLSLLQVHVQDLNSQDDVAQEQILRLAYSSAIMRFVNHMLDSAAARGASMYQAAKNSDIPDWVIDLRHDTAHSNILPSLWLLRNACEFSLQWLKENYWDKYNKYIKDFTTGLKNTASNDENKMNALIYFYSCLSICKHCKIKKTTDIPDIGLREAMLTDAKDLLGKLFFDAEAESIGSVEGLLSLVDLQAKNLLKGKDTTLYVNNALLGEDSLFLSSDLVDFLSKKEFKENQLSRRYVHCFEVLLNFLHTNDLLLEFILALIKMTQSNGDEHSKKLLAALWVSEILASLKKSKKFLEQVPDDYSAHSPEKKKNLKQRYYHWHPNEKSKGLILGLSKPIPIFLTDITFLQPIISTYNPYLAYFVNDLMMFSEPKIPQEVSDRICKLAKLISAPDRFLAQFSPAKIYSINDLKGPDDIEMYDLSENNDVQDEIDTDTVMGIWRKTTRSNWSSCPIGMVIENDKSVSI